MKKIMIPLVLATLTSCASYQITESPAVSKTARWVIMPISNQSTTPMAGQQAEQILSSIMFYRGVETELYPANDAIDIRQFLTKVKIIKRPTNG